MIPIIGAGHNRVPLVQIFRLVLKKIFDIKNFTRDENKLMQSEITAWDEAIKAEKGKKFARFGILPEDLKAVGTKGTPLDEQEFFLQVCCAYLVNDEEGKFEEEKRAYSLPGMDYRKVARFRFAFPELINNQDKIEAAKAVKVAMEKNPEDWGL